MELDESTKQRLLDIIAATSDGSRQTQLSMGDAALLYHWKTHKDDPMYDFVPRKMRRRKK